MNAIALSHNGVIYAYACGRCHQVGLSGQMRYTQRTGPVAGLVEQSQDDAKRCCTCRSCGAPDVDYECETCYAQRESEATWRKLVLTWGIIGCLTVRHITTQAEWEAAHKQCPPIDPDDDPYDGTACLNCGFGVV